MSDTLSSTTWRTVTERFHDARVGKRSGGDDDRRHLVMALAGEVGELCNLVKKDWRREWGDDPGDLSDDITSEIADCAIILHLVARAYGVDLDAAAAKKMDEVLKRYGMTP